LHLLVVPPHGATADAHLASSPTLGLLIPFQFVVTFALRFDTLRLGAIKGLLARLEPHDLPIALQLLSRKDAALPRALPLRGNGHGTRRGLRKLDLWEQWIVRAIFAQRAEG
jgi:hypothetical protein